MTLTQGSIDQFLSSMSVRGNSENTLRAYRGDLRQLLRSEMVAALGDEPLSHPSQLEEAAARYLTAGRKTWAPKTTKRKYAAIRSWAKWAGLGGFLEDYNLPDAGKARPHPIPEGDDAIRRLLDACDRNMQSRALVVLCGWMGLRVGEAIGVKPADFDTEEGTLTVRGKGDKTRVIPVPKRAWPELRPAIAGARLSEGTVVTLRDRAARARITELGRKAELSQRVKSHDLRATAATHLYNVTKDLLAVQEILGHADSATTQVYIEVNMNKMRAAMEAASA